MASATTARVQSDKNSPWRPRDGLRVERRTRRWTVYCGCMDARRRRDLMLRIGFVLLGALLLVQGSVALVGAAREIAAEETVGASIVSSGCTVTVRLAGTRNSWTTSFHVDLCPAIPVGTGVSVVYDQATPVRLLVGSDVIDVATSRGSNDRVGGVVTVLLGAALLVLGALASIPRVRRLPRPSPGWLAVLVAEVALPATFGVISAMKPLQESTAAELSGAAVGLGIGLAIAGATAILGRHHIFRTPG